MIGETQQPATNRALSIAVALPNLGNASNQRLLSQFARA